ncbi:hypothetical protein OV450_3391 [Actinobacteria bacterium OV450]|nr:hypothetical protein OV450_3391 [Actinobacteria bacterium OV450]
MTATAPEICARCGNNYATQGNPFGTAIIALTPICSGDTYTCVLCDPCTRGLLEYVTPELAGDPAYQAHIDQYEATIRDLMAKIRGAHERPD